MHITDAAAARTGSLHKHVLEIFNPNLTGRVQSGSIALASSH